uniref:Uncharacterized protein n=1 Tax=Arundo donax TaxID=35708 RepID=A0A0A9FCT0_ARUDO
MLPLNRGAQ